MDNDVMEEMIQVFTNHPELRQDGSVPVRLFIEGPPFPLPMGLFWTFIINKWLATNDEGHFFFTEKAFRWLLMQELARTLSQLANCCECEQLARLNDHYLCPKCIDAAN